MVFSFRTVGHPAEGIYKEKGSKFLAFVYPVQTEEDIRNNLEALRKEYFDARHHCYAWMLGPERKHFRAFDDGEPNHSAGDPILGQIRSRELTDVLVVVVRYFGGVKLGVGGLITAYRTAAEDALQQAAVLEKEVYARVTLLYDYAATPEVMRMVKEFDLHIAAQDYQERCRLEATVRLRQEEPFRQRVTLLAAMGTDVALEG